MDIVTSMINSRVSTLSGGTRTDVVTNRPWQPKIVFKKQEECIFCTGKGLKNMKQLPTGHKLFDNSFTPFPIHRMLIPDKCGDESVLRSLGGANEIRFCIETAYSDAVVNFFPNKLPLWINIHVGYGAGQNIAHPHWHIYQPMRTQNDLIGSPFSLLYEDNEILMENGAYGLQASITGYRWGQVSIYPIKSDRGLPMTWSDIHHQDQNCEALCNMISDVIELYNKKFNYPDYSLLIAINKVDAWHVHYTPILNNFGNSEVGAILYGTPFVHPTPPSTLVEFLKE